MILQTFVAKFISAWHAKMSHSEVKVKMYVSVITGLKVLRYFAGDHHWCYSIYAISPTDYSKEKKR